MGKIKIIKDGPYHITGGLPLSESIITTTSEGKIYKEGRSYEAKETYSLCRCGNSKNKPYCDGSHKSCSFDGTTIASKEKFGTTAVKYEGKNIILEDEENLCAFARFCHGVNTDAWTLTEDAKNDEEEKLAIKLACDCPSGRLVMHNKATGEAIEPKYEESIVILQDPERNCSGPLWVRGNVEIEDENGEILEKRNRVTLCRCGKSENKPYCDASHVSSKFDDSK